MAHLLVVDLQVGDADQVLLSALGHCSKDVLHRSGDQACLHGPSSSCGASARCNVTPSSTHTQAFWVIQASLCDTGKPNKSCVSEPNSNAPAETRGLGRRG